MRVLPVFDRVAEVAEPSFEQAEFLDAVESIFASLTCPYLERVDASDTPDKVHAGVTELLGRRLSLGKSTPG